MRNQVGEPSVDEGEPLRLRRVRWLVVLLAIGVTGPLLGLGSIGRDVHVDVEPATSDGHRNLVRRALPGEVGVDVPHNWEIRHAQVECFAFGTSPALSWGVGYPSGATMCLPGPSSAPGVLVMLDVLVKPQGEARPTGTGDWQAILDRDGQVREFFSLCHELVVRTAGLSPDVEASVLASVISGNECP